MRRLFGGFTVVEMLVALLVIMILMAAALPAFMSAISNSQRKDCRANMKSIANAEREYRLKTAGDPATAPSYASTLATLATKVKCDVKCPTGGTYSLSSTDSFATNFTVHCSDGTHDAGSNGQAAGYTPNMNTD